MYDSVNTARQLFTRDVDTLAKMMAGRGSTTVKISIPGSFAGYYAVSIASGLGMAIFKSLGLHCWSVACTARRKRAVTLRRLGLGSQQGG